MALAMQVARTGGPDVLTPIHHDPGEPAAGQIRLRQTAIGVNFIDVAHRSGRYPIPLPIIPGLEGAGIVEAVGPEVAGINIGDRVAYASAPPPCGYAELRLLAAERAVPLPSEVSDVEAAALLFQGITVQGLIRSCYPLKAGETVLLHAAAGGVGSILSRWAKHLGARVIGTVSSEAKAEIARAQGCDEAIVHGTGDLAARVRDLTGGRGVDVVYDSIGKETFIASIDSLRPRGMMVCFGSSSGRVEPFPPALLVAKGSLFLTQYGMFHYTADPAEYRERAAEVLKAIAARVITGGRITPYPLAEAARAHRDMEQRRSVGALVLQAGTGG